MSSAVEVSPFVPRGPVAAALHQLRDVIVIAVVTILIFAGGVTYYGVKAFHQVRNVSGQVAQLQRENAALKAAAADTQRQNDARALASQQAIAAVLAQVQALQGTHALTPEQAQAVVGALNAAIQQTTKRLQDQGVTVTPLPAITLPPHSPVPAASPRTAPAPAVNLSVQCLIVCPQGR